jgi:hypothetical protein
MSIWINQTLGAVEEGEVRRVFRDKIGEWSVEVVANDCIRIGVLDHCPSVDLLRRLRNRGAKTADAALAEAAMGGAKD